MSRYTAIISKKAQKQLDKLSDRISDRLLVAIAGLEEDPRPAGYLKLKGIEGFRIRVGNYRIIYDIFDSILVVRIIKLGHRKDIYE